MVSTIVQEVPFRLDSTRYEVIPPVIVGGAN
jgi:hypothetical protein